MQEKPFLELIEIGTKGIIGQDEAGDIAVCGLIDLALKDTLEIRDRLKIDWGIHGCSQPVL